MCDRWNCKLMCLLDRLSMFFLFIKNFKDIIQNYSLCKKCPYSEFFWSVLSRIRTEYGEIRSTQISQRDTERYGEIRRATESECGKIQTRITPNTDTFHAVTVYRSVYHRIDLTLFLKKNSPVSFWCIFIDKIHVQNFIFVNLHMKNYDSIGYENDDSIIIFLLISPGSQISTTLQ